MMSFSAASLVVLAVINVFCACFNIVQGHTIWLVFFNILAAAFCAFVAARNMGVI